MFFSSFPHPFCFLLPLRLCSQKRDRFLSLHLLPPSFRPLPLSCREAVCHFFFLYAPLAMYSILPRAPAPPSAGVSSPTYCTPLLSRLRSILARRRRKGRGRESAQAENERTERQRTDGDSGERLLLLLSLSLLLIQSLSALFACRCCERKCKGGLLLSVVVPFLLYASA